MITEYKYIQFVQVVSTGKTFRWHCNNIRLGHTLGIVKWDGAWRQYCYFPEPGCVYSAGCLKDIADFIAQVMALR